MKYTKWILSLTIVSVMLTSGCFIDLDDDDWGGCVNGSGPIVTETLYIDDFTGVRLEMNAEVHITQGDEWEVVVEGKQNIIDELELDVNGGIWEIETDDCVVDVDFLRIDITMPTIDYLKVSGSGEIVGQNTFNSDEIELLVSGSGDIDVALDTDETYIKVSGSGSVQVEGETTDLECKISGSGDIHAFDCETANANVRISGSGDVDVWVTEYLDVSISGSGDVRYKGYPTIDVSISGSGSLHNAN